MTIPKGCSFIFVDTMRILRFYTLFSATSFTLSSSLSCLNYTQSGEPALVKFYAPCKL